LLEVCLLYLIITNWRSTHHRRVGMCDLVSPRRTYTMRSKYSKEDSHEVIKHCHLALLADIRTGAHRLRHRLVLSGWEKCVLLHDPAWTIRADLWARPVPV